MLRLLALGSSLGLATPWLVELAQPYSATAAWLLDLASNWQWLYVAVLYLCLCLFAWQQRWRWIVLAPLLGLPWLSLAPALPVFNSQPTAELSLVSVNLQQSNNPSALRHWLDQQPVDLLLLQEVTPALAEQLSQWSDYPHQLLAPAESPFGLALLSRHPLSSAQVQYDESGIPFIEAHLQHTAPSIALTLIHPMPPFSPTLHQQLNRTLSALFATQNPKAVAALIVGDFNASPWAQAVRHSAEYDWYRASDLHSTWPAWGLGWFGISIDQVFAKGQWQVVDQQLGPDLGSDHLPRYLRLELLNKD